MTARRANTAEPDRPEDDAPSRGELLTPRGARSRAALLRAARTAFERDGIVAVRPADIAAAAGVSRATFYTYFSDREEILGAVLAETDSVKVEVPVVHRDSDRSRLIAAAKATFERLGYANTVPADIASEAGVPEATFLRYFDDVSEAFTAVLDATREEMLYPTGTEREASIARQIRDRHHEYLTSYARNARLMALLEQAALVYPAYRDLRLRRAESFVARNASWIARLQDQGHADPSLDPRLVSAALSAMVSRLAQFQFALESDASSVDELIDICTQIWLRTLQIDPDETPQ